MNILIALLVFGVLIFVHEMGHFAAARLFKVRVNEFAVGMGPKLFSHKSKKSGTVYSLRLLPIGGFNSIEGENGDSTDESAFCVKPIWQRMIIIVAGAVMNLLFAAILMCIIVLATERLGSTVIHEVKVPESVAEGESEITSNLHEKLLAGDRIVKINGKSVHIVDDLVYTVAFECAKPVSVTVIRDGERTVIEDVVFPTYESQGITFGQVAFTVKREAKNPITVLKHSYFKCVSSMSMIWESVIGLVSGKYGLEQISGPVGVTDALGDAAKSGWLTVANMAVLISMNLGVFNLLPIPALDGGRLVFLTVEAIRKKPIKQEVEGWVNTIGLLVLMIIMVIVSFKDIFVLIGR